MIAHLNDRKNGGKGEHEQPIYRKNQMGFAKRYSEGISGSSQSKNRQNGNHRTDQRDGKLLADAHTLDTEENDQGCQQIENNLCQINIDLKQGYQHIGGAHDVDHQIFQQQKREDHKKDGCQTFFVLTEQQMFPEDFQQSGGLF